MIYMKKITLFLLTIFFISFLISCSGKREEVAQTDVYFFYMELCPSCEEYIMAEKLSEEITTLIKKNKAFNGEILNIIHDDDAKKMKAILTEKNLAQISHVIPLLVVKDSYFVGYEEISAKVEELIQ